MGRELYVKAPTAAELNIWGMSRKEWEEEDQSQELIVWPDNERAFDLFLRIRGQMLMGVNGPTGLNYLVMYHHTDRMGLSNQEFDELHDEMQVLERAALNEIHAE